MYLSIPRPTKIVLKALKTNNFCFEKMYSQQHQFFHKPNFIISWKNKLSATKVVRYNVQEY